MYLDAVMLLNFGVNYGLLKATALLTGRASHRIFWGAFLGAVYAGLCRMPGLEFLAGGPWSLLCLVLLLFAAFGNLRTGMTFLCLSLLLAGALFYIHSRGFWVPALASTALAGCSRLGFSHGGALVPVSVTLDGKTWRKTALRDTGNGLKDPFTGNSVLILGQEAGKTLLGLSDLNHPEALMEILHSRGYFCRLLPYKALGVENGLLLTVRCDRVTVDGQAENPWVAFAAQDFGGEYQALTGGKQG